MGNLTGSSTAEIDAPIERVWELVEDVEAAPNWQGGLKGLHAIERDDDGRAVLCETESDGKVRTLKSIVRFSFDGPTELRWTQEKGDMKSGRRELEARGGGRRPNPRDVRARRRPREDARDGHPRAARGSASRHAREVACGRAQEARGGVTAMATVSVRYFVDDVDAAIEFYCGLLGSRRSCARHRRSRCSPRRPPPVAQRAGRGPGGGAAMPDGTLPAPGGWNRFQLEVDDLESLVGSCALWARASATRSSPASAASRSSSRTPRVTRSSCFTPPVPKRAVKVRTRAIRRTRARRCHARQGTRRPPRRRSAGRAGSPAPDRSRLALERAQLRGVLDPLGERLDPERRAELDERVDQRRRLAATRRRRRRTSGRSSASRPGTGAGRRASCSPCRSRRSRCARRAA